MNLSKPLRVLTLSALFIFFFMTFLQRPVYNNDFWWHLATGKYIFENKELPQQDPYSYTSGEQPTRRAAVILRGYWLAELIFFKVHRLWDLKGIIFLRSVLMTVMLLFLYMAIRKQVFTDGRALDTAVQREYEIIASATVARRSSSSAGSKMLKKPVCLPRSGTRET